MNETGERDKNTALANLFNAGANYIKLQTWIIIMGIAISLFCFLFMVLVDVVLIKIMMELPSIMDQLITPFVGGSGY